MPSYASFATTPSMTSANGVATADSAIPQLRFGGRVPYVAASWIVKVALAPTYTTPAAPPMTRAGISEFIASARASRAGVVKRATAASAAHTAGTRRPGRMAQHRRSRGEVEEARAGVPQRPSRVSSAKTCSSESARGATSRTPTPAATSALTTSSIARPVSAPPSS